MNAGQNPPLLRRTDGTIERLAGTGIALGMFEGSTYEAAESIVRPGDILVLYSDGVTEAENPAGQPFEESGLDRVVAAHGLRHRRSSRPLFCAPSRRMPGIRGSPTT